MTNLDEFKKRIYSPYSEAWEIMKFLSKADVSKDETWNDYMAKCDAFKSKYPSEIGGSIYRVLLDVGSEVGRIVRQK